MFGAGGEGEGVCSGGIPPRAGPLEPRNRGERTRAQQCDADYSLEDGALLPGAGQGEMRTPQKVALAW